MTFAYPNLLWIAGATALVLAIAFALDFTHRRRLLARIGDSMMLGRMMGSLSLRRRAAKAALLVAACTLVVLALARPQVEGELTFRERGIDVAFVMDFSSSMLARDVYPSRLVAMRSAVDVMMNELEADRIAPVLFAGAAVHFPLTHDAEAARSLYTEIAPSDLAPGSDIGEAVMAARCILRPEIADVACERVGGRGTGGNELGGSAGAAPRARLPVVSDRARALVLFTDGEDTAGRAEAEIAQAVRVGIDVYVVGVGTPAGELIPELSTDGTTTTGWKTDDKGEFVTTRLEQAGLRQLAELAGGDGHYYLLDSRFRIERLLDQLKSLQRGDLDQRVLRTPREVFQLFLFPAFVLLLIEACMGDRRRRPLSLRGRNGS